MKMKFFAVFMAAVMMSAMCVSAAEEETAAAAETAAAEEAAAETEAAEEVAAAETEAAEEEAAAETEAAEEEAAAETEAAEEEAAAETEAAEEEAAAEETTELKGLYIVNYAQSSGQVNLNLIAYPDLTCTAQEADTVIYDFREDGTVCVYEGGVTEEGTYTAQDGTLVIETQETKEYEYELVDSLFILHSEEESYILYSFSLEDLNYITIEDYSEIEIPEAAVQVTDEDVENYIQTILQGQTTYEQITEGTTAEGDVVTIAYEGVLEGEEEPFEGGSSEGITLQLGSGALIDNFEEQITGQAIGSTVDVTVTFPEDYSGSEDLAGKTAVFATTIISKTQANTPELTDEWVKTFSETYLPETLESVDALREYSRGYLYNYILHTAMLNALAAKTTITGYNSAAMNMLLNYSAQNLSYYAASYGYNEKEYAAMYGYDSAEAYAQAEAVSYMNIDMIVNKVMYDLGMTYTLEELDAALTEYLKETGYGQTYTTAEYKTQAGTVGMWMYRNLEYKYNLAMTALEDRVVLTQEEQTNTAAEEAEQAVPAAQTP